MFAGLSRFPRTCLGIILSENGGTKGETSAIVRGKFELTETERIAGERDER